MDDKEKEGRSGRKGQSKKKNDNKNKQDKSITEIKRF